MNWKSDKSGNHFTGDKKPGIHSTENSSPGNNSQQSSIQPSTHKRPEPPSNYIMNHRAEVIAGKIQDLRSEHGKHRMIGTHGLTMEEKVELNNYFAKIHQEYMEGKHEGGVKNYMDSLPDAYIPQHILNLIDRIPDDEIPTTDIPFHKQIIVFGHIRFADNQLETHKLANQKRIENNPEMKREWRNYLKEKQNEHEDYREKYDKWGIKKQPEKEFVVIATNMKKDTGYNVEPTERFATPSRTAARETFEGLKKTHHNVKFLVVDVKTGKEIK